jgi:hypothetical protein
VGDLADRRRTIVGRIGGESASPVSGSQKLSMRAACASPGSIAAMRACGAMNWGPFNGVMLKQHFPNVAGMKGDARNRNSYWNSNGA